MVHISDGVLSPQVLAAGWIFTGAVVGLTLRRMNAEQIPRLSLITAAFFVASLIHIPVGPTSVHLILNGLVGVILGPLAYLSVFIGLVLQALLIGHGGITVIGVNSVTMGLPALGVFYLFKFKNTSFKRAELLGALAGGLAVISTVALTSLMLLTTGREFTGVVKALLIVHIPVILIEAVVAGAVVGFLVKVKPEVFLNRKAGR